MKSQVELKHLQTRKEEAETRIKSLEDEKMSILRRIDAERTEIRKIDQSIIALKRNDDIIVSEHAILRYFERVLGFDLEDIKSKVLPPTVKDQVQVLGKSGVFVAPTHKVRMRDGVAVTIMTA